MSLPIPSRADVLIVGGGPAGTAAAYWLADHGHDVVLVERKPYPRDKACGGAITPRAVQELDAMGLGSQIERWHRTEGVRLRRGDREVIVPWPSHPRLPNFGLVTDRAELDRELARAAAGAGATVLDGTEALTPLIERGFVQGATVAVIGSGSTAEIRARYLIVADGANSRFGRLLGTFRRREWPHGTAICAEYRSARHDDRWLESSFDLVDHRGGRLPGYGWVFPAGDGSVNVGVGVLSTARSFNSVNVTDLHHRFAAMAAERWGIDPTAPTIPLQRGRVPLAGSVSPKAGPTYLVIGDAAASASAFNGDGIDAALRSGRLAADTVHTALTDDNPVVLQRYPERLNESHGRHWRLGRRFARIIGHPSTMDRLTRFAVSNRRLAGGALAAMTDELQPGTGGFAGLTYRAATAVSRVLPE